MAKPYICECCGEVFESDRSDEEVLAEAKAIFGELDEENLTVICETCYRAFIAWLAGQKKGAH